MELKMRAGSAGNILSSRMHLSIAPTDLSMSDTPAGTRLRMAGAQLASVLGGPGLLAKPVYVALPPGTVATGVAITDASSALLHRSFSALAHVMPAPDARTARLAPGRLPSGADAVLYAQERTAPQPWIRLIDTCAIGSHRVARLMLCPVRADGDDQLRALRELDVELRLAPAQPLSATDAPPASFYQLQRHAALARALVVNPGDVPGVRSPQSTCSHSVGMVIITDNQRWDAARMQPAGEVDGNLREAFGKLAAWRRQQDLSTSVISVTDIVNKSFGDFTTSARDLQHVLRRFIRWMHDAWGTAYVLLGGCTSIVPTRTVDVGGAAPSDAYYSLLTDTNEWTEGQTIDYSQLDMQIHLSVGRVPAQNGAEAAGFVDKLIAYERMTAADGALIPAQYLRRSLYVATSWDMERRVDFRAAPASPPGDNQFFHAAGARLAVIKVMDLVEITPEQPDDPESPSPGRYAHRAGAAYTKLHLPDETCYKEIAEVIAVSRSGAARTIPYDEHADAGRHGWYLDLGAWTWIKVFDDLAELEPEMYVVRLTRGFRKSQNPNPGHIPNLMRIDVQEEQHWVPYREDAPQAGFGWCFARDETGAPCLTAAECTAMQSRLEKLRLEMMFLRQRLASASFRERIWIRRQINMLQDTITTMQRELDEGQAPTPWLVVHDEPGNFEAPAFARFQLDPAEADGSMADQEVLRKQNAAEFPGWEEVSRLYEDFHDLPPADRAVPEVQQFSTDRVLAKLDAGYHVVSLSGHGLPYTCCDGIDTQLVDRMKNERCPSVVYADSCLTARFTENALSNRFVLNQHGGAVAYVGYTDTVPLGLGKSLQQMFFRGLANTGSLAAAFDARAQLLGPGNDGDGVKRMMLLEALAGDPSMQVHDCNPAALATPRLLSPPDGIQLSSLPRTITFEWEAVENADAYWLVVQSFDTFSNRWENESIDSHDGTKATVTFRGARLGRWFVEAYQKEGKLSPSRASPWAGFDYRASAGLPVPALLKPITGATVIGAVEFSWVAVPGAAQYLVEVEADYGSIIVSEKWFALVSSTTTANSIVLSLPKNDFPFPVDGRWRVTASTQAVRQSSTWRRFYIGSES